MTAVIATTRQKIIFLTCVNNDHHASRTPKIILSL